MRISVTLDEGVAKHLRDEMRRHRISLRAAVNHFLRIGLKSPRADGRKPFVVHPLPMGLPLDSDHECVEGLIQDLEGREHR